MRPDLPIVATSSHLPGLRKVGIKELKNKLSEYLRLVADGEVVLVTNRGRVVAQLSPPSQRTLELLRQTTLRSE